MDLPFLMLVVLLTGIGVIMMFSASYADALYNQGNPTYYFMRQALFAVAGLAIMYVVSKTNYQHLRWMSVLVLGGSIVLLVLVKVPGIGASGGGADRWIRAIGPLPRWQPSEAAKLGIILYFSARLSKRSTEKKRKFDRHKFSGRLLEFLDHIGFLELVPYGAILLVIAGLLLWEPHLSATILMLAIGASILFAAGIKLGWFAAGGTLMVAALWVVANATDYMADRLAIWQNPMSDPRGDGYQILQSLYAIGSGGLLGVGLGNSRQKYLWLPELQNDYVFPIVCEELGFIGAAMILILFALLIIRGYWLAIHARDRFGALLIVGITTQVAVQVFLNIGVVTNLLPPTGISLPFFSYGGTALIIQLVEMGIILGVSRQIPAPKAG
ncbi:MAG TPA: putative lipid II flippase FtsW [Candidatus Intestinimonas pullistercoris]|uniref:Probable peptidoglycan glycosyltransferase FtsW n=2 Tax=Intestinimonas TaxID=1392389 RepID=A0A9D2P3C8_9FIRM|nr:putative lipid II flippase FtsW [Candidatus Intestinimonas pullistercoris]